MENYFQAAKNRQLIADQLRNGAPGGIMPARPSMPGPMHEATMPDASAYGSAIDPEVGMAIGSKLRSAMSTPQAPTGGRGGWHPGGESLVGGAGAAGAGPYAAAIPLMAAVAQRSDPKKELLTGFGAGMPWGVTGMVNLLRGR